MEKNRRIQKVIKSKPTLEGAGVHLKRAFGFGEVHGFDPFLLLDDFRSDNPEHYLKGFRGIRIAASRPSPISCVEKSNTGTVWRTKA
jgi:redox-sensitive bicupin YhaK (pirin superfamily)